MREWPIVSAKDAITSLAVDRGVQEMIDLIRYWHRHKALDFENEELDIIVFSESYDEALAFVGSEEFFGDAEIIAHVVVQ